MHPGDGGPLVCDHCGSIAERAVVYDVETFGGSAQSCPQCAKVLLDARIEGRPVLYCASC